MQHQPAVANRPSRATLALLTHEPVLHTQAIVGKGIFVEQMSKLVVKAIVFCIIHFYGSTFNNEGVFEVIVQRMIFDFNLPTG